MSGESNEEYTKIMPNRCHYSVVPATDKELLQQRLSQIKASATNSNKNGSHSTNRGMVNQVIVTGAVLLLAAGCGMPIGYSAVLLPQLYNSNESISIDIEMGSWIASVHSLSTPIGSLFSGSIADRFGRRTTMLMSVIPLLTGWCTLALSSSYLHLLIGRVIAGAAVGILGAPAQILIAEVAEPKLRGVLIGVPYFSYSMGILIIYALGSYFHWRTVAWYAMILPFLAGVAIYFIPESPVWLVRNGYLDKAERALRFLRGNDLAAKEELNQLIDRLEQEKANAQEAQTSENIVKLCCQRIALKPLVIVNIFNVLQMFSGTFLVVFYAIDIITEFGGDIDSKKAAVLTAVVRMVCTLLFCGFLLILRRRTIIHISGIGSGVSCLAFGIYLIAKIGQPKTPFDTYFGACCLVSYIAFNTPLMVMPGVMVGELFPAKVRGRIAGGVFALNNILLFGLTKIFPVISKALKTHGLFMVFGISSILASVFMFLLLPETKDKTLSDIEDYFSQSNWFWFNRKKNYKKCKTNDVGV